MQKFAPISQFGSTFFVVPLPKTIIHKCLDWRKSLVYKRTGRCFVRQKVDDIKNHCAIGVVNKYNVHVLFNKIHGSWTVLDLNFYNCWSKNKLSSKLSCPKLVSSCPARNRIYKFNRVVVTTEVHSITQMSLCQTAQLDDISDYIIDKKTIVLLQKNVSQWCILLHV